MGSCTFKHNQIMTLEPCNTLSYVSYDVMSLASPADKKGGADLAHCACIYYVRWPGMNCTFPYNTIDTHSKPYSYE